MSEQEDLVNTLRVVSSVTSNIQGEITAGILRDPERLKLFRREQKMPENLAMERINNGVSILVGLMPLACHSQVNIFMQALGTHSNFTGNPAVHEAMRILNEEELNKELEGNS